MWTSAIPPRPMRSPTSYRPASSCGSSFIIFLACSPRARYLTLIVAFPLRVANRRRVGTRSIPRGSNGRRHGMFGCVAGSLGWDGLGGAALASDSFGLGRQSQLFEDSLEFERGAPETIPPKRTGNAPEHA